MHDKTFGTSVKVLLMRFSRQLAITSADEHSEKSTNMP